MDYLKDTEKKNLLKCISKAFIETNYQFKNNTRLSFMEYNDYGRILRSCILYNLTKYFSGQSLLNSNRNHEFYIFSVSSGETFTYKKIDNSYNPIYIEEDMLFPEASIPRTTIRKFNQLCVKGKRTIEEVYFKLKNGEQIPLFNSKYENINEITNLDENIIISTPSFNFELDENNLDINTIEAK